MNVELLVAQIKEAVSNASDNLEACRSGFLSLIVPNVRVIGKTRIHSLSTLVDLTLRKAKRVIAPILAFEGLLLILLLSVL
jgi:hypothetical protein